MNYPIESIAWVAPTIFLILMIGFPIIGVFGGWKRAAYWGGGNFLFYVIGLLIWTFAGKQIVAPLSPLIEQALAKAGTTVDVSKLVYSFASPIFFVIVLLFANLLLLINYYAWFKRVVGLSKYKTVKSKDKEGKVVKTKVKNKVQLSTKGKVINMVVGGVGMTALMIPTVFGFTEAVYMGTTSYKTRKNNGFSSSIYNAVVGADQKINWFSYYTSASKDFDALFGSLSLLNREVTVNIPGQEQPFTGTAIDALSQVLSGGIGEIFTNTTSEAATEDEKIEKSIASANELADSWNDLLEKAADDITPIFNSSNATELITNIMGDLAKPEKLTPENINNYIGENCAFARTVQAYKNGYYTSEGGEKVPVEVTPFTQIDVDQECYDNISKAVCSSYTFDESLTEEQKTAFTKSINELIGMMFI